MAEDIAAFLRARYDERVRLLALPFAGHSDYREEWKP